MPDEILKVERKKAKALVEAGAEESFRNNEIESFNASDAKGMKLTVVQ